MHTRQESALAREKRYTERVLIRFEAGVMAAIDSVKGNREDRSEFIRTAVDKEIANRRKGAGK
jgi:hypothetical protein